MLNSMKNFVVDVSLFNTLVIRVMLENVLLAVVPIFILAAKISLLTLRGMESKVWNRVRSKSTFNTSFCFRFNFSESGSQLKIRKNSLIYFTI